MCPRGGSKGGKHPGDVTDINVGNKATQKTQAWHVVSPRFRQKESQWEKTHWLYKIENWGKSESHRAKRKRG